jgi:hypothetical protein
MQCSNVLGSSSGDNLTWCGSIESFAARTGFKIELMDESITSTKLYGIAIANHYAANRM